MKFDQLLLKKLHVFVQFQIMLDAHTNKHNHLVHDKQFRPNFKIVSNQKQKNVPGNNIEVNLEFRTFIRENVLGENWASSRIISVWTYTDTWYNFLVYSGLARSSVFAIVGIRQMKARNSQRSNTPRQTKPVVSYTFIDHFNNISLYCRPH